MLVKQCGWCGIEFGTEIPEQQYCRPAHSDKAKQARQRLGLSGQSVPLAAMRALAATQCPWCGEMFPAPSPGQVYCSAAHRQLHRRCVEKKSFLTEPAAQEMARFLFAKRGRQGLETYKCPVHGGDHWHLRNADKRKRGAA